MKAHILNNNIATWQLKKLDSDENISIGGHCHDLLVIWRT